MEHTIPTDNPAPDAVKSWQLWFSLGAGTVVWAVHLLVVYALTSLTCEWGWFPFSVGALTGLQFVQTMLSIAAGLVTVVAGYLAFANLRHLQSEEPAYANRHRFMARMGVALNLLFTALIVFSLAPIFTLPICG